MTSDPKCWACNKPMSGHDDLGNLCHSLTAARATIAEQAAKIAELEAEAGQWLITAENCETLRRRCAELEAIVRETRDLIQANAGGYDALASHHYDQLLGMLAKGGGK